MVYKVIPLIFALWIFSTLNVLSQSSPGVLMPEKIERNIYLGPVVGYNLTMHKYNLSSFDEAICPKFIDGNGSGFFVGLSWEQMFGDAKTSNSSIIVRLLYNYMPGSTKISENPLTSYIPIVDANNNITDELLRQSQTSHTIDINYSMITGEVMYKLNPVSGFPLGFTIGPVFDFILAKDYTQKYLLENPLEAQFRRNDELVNQKGYKYTDNDRTIIIKDEAIPEASSFRFAIKAGLQYEILTSGQWYIVPSLAYNFGLTDVKSNESWKVHAIQVGVDVRYAFKF